MTDDLIRKLRAAECGGYREETYTKLCGDAADALARSSEQIADAERALFKLNSGEELQSLMRLNNDLQARAIAAETRLVEAEGVILDLLGNFKPFTSRPIGAPHSAARLEQESQVFAHKNATDWINASLSSACAKCGCDTKGEMAFVDNKILCHPCADAVSSPVGGGNG